MPCPSPRAIRGALGVLERLPAEALAHLAEWVIGRLDAAEPDTDLEQDDHDGCMAEDATVPGHLGLGDDGDAEQDDPQGDERDDADAEAVAMDLPPGVIGTDPVTGPAECSPLHLRAERDGTVQLRRRLIVVKSDRHSKPVRVQSMWWEARE